MNYLDMAIDVAREAGELQLRYFNRTHKIEYKGITNIVTEVDKKCEHLIIKRLKRAFPTHGFLAEEGGGKGINGGRDNRYRWIIDPLDGTVNYTHGYPLFDTSIALEKNGKVVVGVVFEPNKDELFAAEEGGGAELNGRRIKVSGAKELRKSLLDTGFAYNIREGEKRNNVKHFVNFLMRARAIRRDGAAAADLCYVACGRFDGFWELYLRPWDIAAGQLIIKEAGGAVSAFDGSPLNIYGNEILASNGRIHNQMIEVLCRKK